MKRYLAIGFLISGVCASVAIAQTPGTLTLNSVQLLANGKTITLIAPPSLGSDQTFQFPDVAGAGTGTFIMSESSTMQSINTGGLQIVSGGLQTNSLILVHPTANVDLQFNVAQRPSIYPSGSNVPTNLNLQVRSAGTGTLQLNYDNNGPIELGSQNGNTVQISSAGGTTRIGNLTTNGIIQTNGGNGTLSVATEGTTYLATIRHDLTLTGSGTTGSNLALNLGSANTWSATQTFSGITMNGDFNAANFRITNVPTIPLAGTDAINRTYVDNGFALKTGDATIDFSAKNLAVNNNLTVSGQLMANLNAGNNRITNLAAPSLSTDALNLGTANTLYAPLNGSATNDFTTQTLTINGTLDANSNRIINVPTVPTASTDAINQSYVTSTFALKNGSSTTNFSTDDLTVSGTLVASNTVNFSGAFFTMGNSTIQNVGNPFNSGDAANKAYVDATASSDVRFKKEILPAQAGLNEVEQMNSVTYYFRTEEFPSRAFSPTHQIGFIAQEMEKIVPQAVRTDNDGYKMIDYGHLTPVLVNAIKEQQKMIEEQKQELALKERELTTVKNQLAIMKSEMEEVKLAITKLGKDQHTKPIQVKAEK